MDARENAKVLDPTRFQIAKSMSVMPGGAPNNNPMNVTDNASPPIQGTSIYGDHAQNYAQMGTGVVMPQPNTQNPQNATLGTGYNSSVAYGYQQQPGADAQEALEGARLGGEASGRDLNTSQFMGMIGMPAQPAPGGVMPSPQQSAGTLIAGASATTAQTPPPGGMNMKSGKRG